MYTSKTVTTCPYSLSTTMYWFVTLGGYDMIYPDKWICCWGFRVKCGAGNLNHAGCLGIENSWEIGYGFPKGSITFSPTYPSILWWEVQALDKEQVRLMRYDFTSSPSKFIMFITTYSFYVGFYGFNTIVGSSIGYIKMLYLSVGVISNSVSDACTLYTLFLCYVCFIWFKGSFT